MPREATGQIRKLASGGFEARVTLEPGRRKSFELRGCHGQQEAEARARTMADMAKRLRKAGELGDAVRLLEMAALASTPEKLATVQGAVDAICSGQVPKVGTTDATTFQDFAEQWTSGKLHERWPDYVKVKRSVYDDTARLAKLFDVVGPVPLAKFTIGHAEAAMRNLSAKLSPASRRHYAQLMHRILGLAVYPARLIPSNPLPKGFLPSTGPGKALTYLYPDEDAKLMGAPPKKVPLCYRVLYGFLDREGCRAGEAQALRWGDVDLSRGAIKLDVNKTDDPRSWALDPGVVRALEAWRDMRTDTGADEPLFIDEHGRPMQVDGLAERFREEHLRAAGVDRATLYEKGPNRRPIQHTICGPRSSRSRSRTARPRHGSWIGPGTRPARCSTSTGAPRARSLSSGRGRWPRLTRPSLSSAGPSRSLPGCPTKRPRKGREGWAGRESNP